MNKNTVSLLIQGLVKVVGGAVVAKGYLSNSQFTELIGLVVALVGQISTHIHFSFLQSLIPEKDESNPYLSKDPPVIPPKLPLILFAIIPILALSGCTSMSGIIAQLKDDPAIVTGSVMSPYGSFKFTRVGSRTNETISVGTDGTVTVKSP